MFKNFQEVPRRFKGVQKGSRMIQNIYGCLTRFYRILELSSRFMKELKILTDPDWVEEYEKNGIVDCSTDRDVCVDGHMTHIKIQSCFFIKI